MINNTLKNFGQNYNPVGSIQGLLKPGVLNPEITQSAGLSSVATPAQLKAATAPSTKTPKPKGAVLPSVPPVPKPDIPGSPNQPNIIGSGGSGLGGLTPEQISHVVDTSGNQSITEANANTNPGAGASLPPVGVPTPSSNTVAGILPSLFGATLNQPDVTKARENIQGLQNKYAEQTGIIGASPVGLSVQGGEQGLLNQMYATKLGAAQTALANAQQEQQLQQQGLGTALGAVAPITGVPYGTQVVQPGLIGAPGSQTGGAEVQPSDPFYQTLQTYAQLLATNQGSAIPASVTGNSVLNAQLQKMAKEINPSYNVNVAAGTGAAEQSTATTAGTAGVGAAQNVFNQAYGTYNQLQNAVQNVDQFGNLLTSGMVDSAGNAINPSNAKFLNMPLAELRNQLSSAQQAQFDSTYAALKGKISGLLSVGGNEIPTQITADANKILDGTAPLGTLQATLQRIQQEGNILLKNQADIVNQNWEKIKQGGTPQTNALTGTPNPWH